MVGSFLVRVSDTNFLGFMQNWRRRTIGIRRASWWSGDAFCARRKAEMEVHSN